MNYEQWKGDLIQGVRQNGAITVFTIENRRQKECVLLLWPKDGGEPKRIPMEADKDQPALYTVAVKELPLEQYDYTYELGGIEQLDPYGERIVGREQWGDITRKKQKIKCGFNNMEGFLWGEDRLPHIPKQDMVMYKLHVRGFSMLQKLPEEERGTFRGIERKLTYLKELGVTTLELMPIYEFEEMFAQDPFQQETFPEDKINYWGYTRGNYFALKSAYLGAGHTEDIFRKLVQRMHKLQMECILEFYFDERLNLFYILDVLRYWAREYHVDGFHLICGQNIAELIAQDPCLNGRKLFYEGFSEERCQPENRTMDLFSLNDSFLYGVRKVMNHQGGSIMEFADNMRRQQKHQGFVNYLASNNGFTLWDSFSYKEKHNQENGEENRDGLSWNCSSNCGEEGVSRKRHVNQLRERQIKNALCALMFGQGVPLLWMGDESGNSQGGNNNAYCQDNETGWRSWDNTKRTRELTAFVRQLTRLRKRYPALSNPLPMELSDYRRLGYPDLSYHGNDGWRTDRGHDKTIGMLYACNYRPGEENVNDDFIYIGYNFSLSPQMLALPDLPKGYGFYTVLDTGREAMFEERRMEAGARTFEIRRQAVCMLVGRREADPCRK